MQKVIFPTVEQTAAAEPARAEGAAADEATASYQAARPSESRFRFKRREANGGVAPAGSLSELLGDWKGADERWLFIAPHDDDIVMGAGLLLQSAVAAGVTVSVLITTDGSMGYCDAADRDRIGEIRLRETLASFAILGIEEVSWLGFPDCNLAPYTGRRRSRAGDPCTIGGFTGLQNAYTYELRRRRPTRLFLASGNDLHPDHKTVYQEARISIFHAGGAIWPELGTPLEELPQVYEWAVYCAFPAEPDYLIEAPASSLEKKLAAISAYQSQKQIGRLVARLRDSGPVEYLKISDFSFYSPQIYRHLFEPEH